MLDYIHNNQAHGSVATMLLNNGMDHNCLRPFIDDKDPDRSWVTVIRGGKPIVLPTTNAAALRRDDWKFIDDAVIRTQKPELRVFGDLRAAGLTLTIPNGMSKTVLEYDSMGDITPATLSMDGMREAENDRVLFETKGLPLPIVHKDFHFSSRQIMVARGGGTPLDTYNAELATRRCAEEIEKLTLGVSSSYSFAGYTIYGYTNFPERQTKVLTLPTAAGWVGSTLVGEILDMVQLANNDQYFGPFGLYFSPSWNRFLNDDYSQSKGEGTLRARIALTENISFIRTAQYLTGYQVLLVQMRPEVVRAILGMDLVTVQWESMGGFRVNFKVLGIMVPQLRPDHDGNSGIVHGTAS